MLLNITNAIMANSVASDEKARLLRVSTVEGIYVTWTAPCESVNGHVRTTKAQISLRIRAGWSRPSVSANRIIRYHRMYEKQAKARMIWICVSCTCSKVLLCLTRPIIRRTEQVRLISQRKVNALYYHLLTLESVHGQCADISEIKSQYVI